MSLRLSTPVLVRVACRFCGAHRLLENGKPDRGCQVCGCVAYEEVDA